MTNLRSTLSFVYRGLLSVLISVVFIWLAFRDIDLSATFGRLNTITLEPILLCILGQIIFQILHWLRWGLILRQIGHVSWKQIFIMGAIGNAALYILPVRSGELIRPALVAREEQINLGQATATSVIERIIDGLLICIFFFGSLLLVRQGTALQAVYKSGLLFLGFLILVIAIIFIGSRRKEAVMRIIRLTIGRLSSPWGERIVDLYDGFDQGIRILSVGNILPLYLGLSVALWMIDIFSIYWLFGILSVKPAFIAAFVVISFLAIGSLIPSGPAQLGVFEFSIVLGLGIFSVGSEEAVLFATIFHVIVIGLISIAGILGFWLDRFRSTTGGEPQSTA